MKNVVFVCTGNTCRSPMAEGIFRQLTADRADVTVSSAGISPVEGAPLSNETARILQALGEDTSACRSRGITRELLESATHVFAMCSSHLSALSRMYPEFEGKYYRASEFAPADDLRDTDVPDPFGGGPAEYQHTFQLLRQMLPSLLAYIDSTDR